MPQWTDEQEKVMQHRGTELLVSAAAGSGKTAVLVERLIRRLTDEREPLSLDKVLVMTFTEAAASEMKERIRQRLEALAEAEPDRPQLQSSVLQLPTAYIQTIDSLCKRLITENYVRLEIEPGFRVADGGELKLLRGDLLKELLDERFASGDERFYRFAHIFSIGREDGGLAELVLSLYETAQATPWPGEWLQQQREALLAEMEGAEVMTADRKAGDAESAMTEAKAAAPLWQLDFAARMKTQLAAAAEQLAEAMEICEQPDGPESYLPTLKQEREALIAMCDIDELGAMMEALQRFSFEKLKGSRSALRDIVQDKRKQVKVQLEKIQKLNMPLPEELAERARRESCEDMLTLLDLCEDFSERFAAQKRRRNIVDFSDLEHFALELLYEGEGSGRRFSALADQYAAGFEEVMVDEYQDSNYVQEALLQALSAARLGRPDVFQVGDIKQSIYSFRQAKPELFLSKFSNPNYPVLELSRNFRSSTEVIESVNALFSTLMRPELGGIRYDARAALYPGRVMTEQYPQPDRKTELLLLDYAEYLAQAGEGPSAQDWDETEEDLGKAELEGAMLAARIRRLVSEEGYNYRDIVILLRSPGSWADTLVEVLAQSGVPAYAVSVEGYFDTPEIESMLALLSIIDNPRQDIPLAAALHSEFFDFSDEELVHCHRAFGSLQGGLTATDEQLSALPQKIREKWQHFLAELTAFRRAARYLSIHELIYRIFEKTGFDDAMLAMPAGEKRRANLEALLEAALNFEKTSYRGLFNFIRYIERQRSYEVEQGEVSIHSEHENLVRIMSIHKSKGLQFPVIFVSGLGRKFNRQSLNERILMDSELGLACDYVDLEQRERVPMLKRLALRQKKEWEQLGEELRVLYVALTRAQEKLILTGCARLGKRIEKLAPGAQLCALPELLSAGSYLDWVLASQGERLLGSGPIHLYLIRPAELWQGQQAAAQDNSERYLKLKAALRSAEQDRAVSERVDSLRARLQSRYPFEAATRLYPIHSVSELKRKSQAAEQREGEAVPVWLRAVPDLAMAAETDGLSSAAAQRQASDSLSPASAQGQASGAAPAQSRCAGTVQDRMETAARRGIAVHRFLSLCDFTRETGDISAQAVRYMNSQEQAMLNLPQLQTLFDSSLGQLLAGAQREGKLYREQHFMYLQPYSRLFAESELEEEVFLQGIVDAFIRETDGITLIDYKTDRVDTPEQLSARYHLQLELYADALNRLLGQPIKAVLIYSLHLGAVIELALQGEAGG